MPAASKELLFECRMALHLTQEQFGDLVGRNKRTIQRWEDAGTVLLPSDADALARALQPARPDLAQDILAAGRWGAEISGQGPPAAVSASPEQIGVVLRAAAEAMGVTPEAIRPALAAAFEKADEVGLDVEAVIAALAAGREAYWSPPATLVSAAAA